MCLRAIHRRDLNRCCMPRAGHGFRALFGFLQDIFGRFAFGGCDPPCAMGAKAHPVFQIFGHAFERMALPLRHCLQRGGGFGGLAIHLAYNLQRRAYGLVAAREPRPAKGLGLIKDASLRAPELFALWRPCGVEGHHPLHLFHHVSDARGQVFLGHGACFLVKLGSAFLGRFRHRRVNLGYWSRFMGENRPEVRVQIARPVCVSSMHGRARCHFFKARMLPKIG